MVGRLRNDRLIVYGVATAKELPSILDSANIAPALHVAAQGDGFGPSDHSSFYAKNIPVPNESIPAPIEPGTMIAKLHR